jgi:uncharacterized protein (TIGR03435 family)
MTLEKFILHPAVQATGYALLQFLWQGAFLASLLFVAGRWIRRSPALRYAVGCAVLFSMPVVLGITILRSHTAAADSGDTAAPAARPARIAMADSGADRRTASEIEPAYQDARLRQPAAPFAGWVVCIWFAGIVTLSIQMAGGWVRAQRLRAQATQVVNGIWTRRLEALARRLEISRPVRLYMSARAEVPAVVGWLRPCLLLPLSAITGLDPDQWTAVLAHELAHIRRHDYLVNLLQTAVETILFYHPAVWWVSRRIRQEREHCCDDLAVTACGSVQIYAGALARLEELRGVNVEPAVAATGGDLLARVRRLTALERKNHPRPAPIAAMLAAVLPVVLVMAMAFAPGIRGASSATGAGQETPQAAAPASALKFDVASVKACKEEPERGNQRRREFIVTPGRANVDCITLERMIYFAYAGIGSMDHPLLNSHPGDPSHVRGGAGWVRSEKFSITATAEGITSREVMMGPMLRALLEERFQLKTHRETEEVAMYALTIAKGGMKIRPIEPGGCTTPDRDLSLEQIMKLDRGNTPICGNFTATGDGVNRNWSLGGTTLGHFANSILSGVLDRYVIDQTGLTSRFNIRLHFALDQSIRPNVFGGGRPVDPPPADVEKAPAIFQALEQQLGLKLEKTKGRREFLVIDRVQRPSDN